MLLCTLTAALVPAQSAYHWKTQFFHDRDDSSLQILDFQCPSTRTCIAVGTLASRGKEKIKGTSVVTRNGGVDWEYADLKELPYSVFFLNDSLGWMVTDKGIWRTDEAARDWRKIAGLKGVERLSFLNPEHGFAVGEKKSIWETTDGGKSWNALAIEDPSPLNPADVVYESIVFADARKGWVAGSWNPMRRAQELQWMDSGRRANLPMSTVLTQTLDGGLHWKVGEAKVQGRLTKVRYLKDNTILILAEFLTQSASAPSEIFKFDAISMRGVPVFRQTGRVGRDFIVLPNGETIVAAVELPGKSNVVPIPGKLRMMETTGFSTWLDERADYRAVAMHPILAGPDADHVFVATDTGMILQRVRDTTPAK